MNGIRKACWGAAMVLLLVGSSSGCDGDEVADYCGQYSYCYASYDYDYCMESMQYQKESALNTGEECHAAFLDYVSCVGNLDCVRLVEWDTDGSHCGGVFSDYQDVCLGVVF